MLSKLINKHWQILSYLILSVGVRLINIKQALFFTWDNGRDFFAIFKIAQGDITLIGPTTGLQGLYLGPFWYYLGLPGLWLSNGNPYLFLLYYIGVTLLVLPFFWQLAHILFKENKQVAVLTALLLSLMPGSVWGTLRVWNPQIGILLVTLLFLCLYKARRSAKFLWLCGLWAGLLVQSQFAYGIFFVVALPFLVRFVRQKFVLKEQLYVLFPLLLTLTPQILFELKNNFLMTKSLWANLLGRAGGEKLPWIEHFLTRPSQLFTASQDITVRGREANLWFFVMMFVLMMLGLYLISRGKNVIWQRLQIKNIFAWQLLAIMAVLPYPFYLFWRGNNGFFFDYYVTAHFIFLIPLMMLGLFSLTKLVPGKAKLITKFKWLFLAVIFFLSGQFLWQAVVRPMNNAGLAAMDQAVVEVFSWMEADGQNPGVIRIFTPNTQTEHYDAIVHWRAKQFKQEVPHTILNEENYWYTILEPANEQVVLFDSWVTTMAEQGDLLRQEKVGDLIIETWVKHEVN